MSRTRSPLWVWEALEVHGDQWYTIAAIIPGSEFHGTMPLITRDRISAERMRPIAEGHGRVTGEPIRLATYQYSGVASLPDA